MYLFTAKRVIWFYPDNPVDMWTFDTYNTGPNTTDKALVIDMYSNKLYVQEVFSSLLKIHHFEDINRHLLVLFGKQYFTCSYE